MKRLLIQLDEESHRRLRQRAFRQERSISAVIREIVSNSLAEDASRKRRTHISQFASVGAGRSKQGRLSPVSEKHDEALVAAIEKERR
jgi:plasmid stability protein